MTILLSQAPLTGKRAALENDLRRYKQAARESAARGDIEASARSILAMLDCERRMEAQGPQVLQVIKPRSASSGLVS